jgi:hypothetical protein
MPTLEEFYTTICAKDLFPSSVVTDPERRRQRQANLNTAIRYLAASYNTTPQRLPLTTEVEAAYRQRLRYTLTARGKGVWTIRNAIQNIGPRPSEGQFFGQVDSEHFVSRCDETKWCAFRASFCWGEGPPDAFVAPFYPSAKGLGHVWPTHNSW